MPVSIPLTKGLATLVDEADAELLGRYRWYAAGGKSGQRNAQTSITEAGLSRKVYLHRLLLDAPAGVDVDHINGDPLDNRRANLRLASRGENNQNQHRLRSDNGSGFRGVSWHGHNRTWRARVTVGGRETVTYHRSREAAALAVVEMRRTLMSHAPEREGVLRCQ